MSSSGDSDYVIVFINDELNKVGSWHVVSFATQASLLCDFTDTADCCGPQNGSTQGHATVLEDDFSNFFDFSNFDVQETGVKNRAASVRACVRACVRRVRRGACVRACVRVCVCVPFFFSFFRFQNSIPIDGPNMLLSFGSPLSQFNIPTTVQYSHDGSVFLRRFSIPTTVQTTVQFSIPTTVQTTVQYSHDGSDDGSIFPRTVQYSHDGSIFPRRFSIPTTVQYSYDGSVFPRRFRRRFSILTTVQYSHDGSDDGSVFLRRFSIPTMVRYSHD